MMTATPLFRKILLLLAACIVPVSIYAAIPTAFNYQGYLKDSTGVPVNGKTNFTFALYSSTGGTGPVWNDSRQVEVRNGIYSVELGSAASPLPAFDKPYFLGIRVENEAELRPLQPLYSAPYAMRSAVADSVADGSLTASKFGSFCPDNSVLAFKDGAVQCGVIASFSNGAGLCMRGDCRITACSPGYGDCDSKVANGCETPTTSDTSNCGSCNHACQAHENCTQSTCVPCGTCLQPNGSGGCTFVPAGQDPFQNCPATSCNGSGACTPCPPGYTSNGTSCVAIVTCATTPCFPGVACNDTPTGFVCGTCPTGFSGNGITCVDTNGCSPNPCFPGVTCTDVAAPGTGFTCGPCPPGYSGDGVTCVDTDGCSPNPCFPGVTCTDLPAPQSGYICGACPPGYSGDGIICVDTDGCSPNPCFPGVSCTDLMAPQSGYSCGPCPTGFSGNGITCVDTNSCSPNPCFPGVTCTDLPAPQTGYICDPCPSGYTGDGITCIPS